MEVQLLCLAQGCTLWHTSDQFDKYENKRWVQIKKLLPFFLHYLLAMCLTVLLMNYEVINY